jgi:hypothetical protein
VKQLKGQQVCALSTHRRSSPPKPPTHPTPQGKHAFRSVDHHWDRSTFATAGATVELWDHGRSEPVNSFSWGSDSVVSVRFNPVGAAWRGWSGGAGFWERVSYAVGSLRDVDMTRTLNAPLPSSSHPPPHPSGRPRHLRLHRHRPLHRPLRPPQRHAPPQARDADALQRAGLEPHGGVQLYGRERGLQPVLVRHAQADHGDERAQGGDGGCGGGGYDVLWVVILGVLLV